jgi:alpha-D-ribose 1-methylphosphonate 5-triphosphate synthase subunit PhnG
VLANATVSDLERAWFALQPKPHYDFLRAPETGLAQIRARLGGQGQQFNCGEATVSRCVVQLHSGAIGVGYVLGREWRHAELVAVFDALLQSATYRQSRQHQVIAVLAATQARRQRQEAEAVAATRVNFFTMVRGE